jgi:hypothetical protein
VIAQFVELRFDRRGPVSIGVWLTSTSARADGWKSAASVKPSVMMGVTTRTFMASLLLP